MISLFFVKYHYLIVKFDQELKRSSRDMETETEEELFLAVSTNACDSNESHDASLSVSLSDKSLSTDHIEEVASDQPFEGKLVLTSVKV